VQSTRTVLWSVMVYSVGLDVAQLSLQRHQGTLIPTTQGFGNYLCWKRKKLRLGH
jgi:hypothetical protein